MSNSDTNTKPNQIVSDFLSELDRIGYNQSLPLYVPTLGKTVQFKQLTTAQQKELLKSSIDSPLSQTKFILSFFKILNDNFFEKISYSNLNMFDKYAIGFQIRNSIGNSYTHTDDDTKIKYKVDFSNIVDSIKSIEPQVTGLLTSTISDGIFQIDCNICSIENEYTIESQIKSKTDDLTIKDVEELRKILSQLIIQEVSKYINKIVLLKEEKTLDFSILSFSDKIKVLEKIPMTLTKKVIAYIDSVKNVTDQVRSFKGIDENGNEKEVKIPLEASLFIS